MTPGHILTNASETQPIAELHKVRKVYGSSQAAVTALNSVTVSFPRGKFSAIMGPSGCGKSTMLHILAGLDTATSGNISVEGIELTTLSDDNLTKLRRERIGFIFQSFNLIPTLDARTNILLPFKLSGKKPDTEWMDYIISTLGIGHRLSHLPSQLSGGQQQRVAIARALVMKPAIVVADEPTGNLDSQSSREVLTLLRTAVDELNQSVIMVTHDPGSATITDNTIILRDGQIVTSLSNPTMENLTAVLR